MGAQNRRVGAKAACALRAGLDRLRGKDNSSGQSGAAGCAIHAKRCRHGQPKERDLIWYDTEAEAAARFYAGVFPDSAVGAIHKAPSDYPSGKAGDVLMVEFTVAGLPCLGLNGGPAFPQTEAFSIQIVTEDQAETDRYWNAIIGNGGRESACGWCKDRWGGELADHTPGADGSDGGGRRRSAAGFRRDDGDGQDRRRRDKGRAAWISVCSERLRLHADRPGGYGLRWPESIRDYPSQIGQWGVFGAVQLGLDLKLS